MPTGPLDRGSEAESGSEAEGDAGLGWCETHGVHHLASDSRLLPADVDGVPVEVREEVLYRRPQQPGREDPPLDALTYGLTVQETKALTFGREG